MCLAIQSCLTLCNPTDCSPPGSLCPWDFPGKNTGVGCHFLLQGIFPIQGSNPHLLRWQADFLFSQPATREATLGRADCFPQYKDSNANIFLKHLHRHTPKYSLTRFPGTCDLVKGTGSINHQHLTDDVQSPVCSLAGTANLWCSEPDPPGWNYLEQDECGHLK